MNKDEEKSIKILVCYHKKDRLFKNEILVPIHCGRALACEASKDGKISKKDYQWMIDNMIGDDTGENISKLNRDVNEMSAIYWAWKNYDKLGNPDYIGLCHYRRIFDFSDVIKTPIIDFLDNMVLNKKLINQILNKYDFIYRAGLNITDNTLHTFEPYQISAKLSEKYHSILFKQYEKFLKEKVFYTNSMFIMKKEDFFTYCEEIMSVMFDFYNNKEDANKKFLEWHKKHNTQERYEEALDKIKNNNNLHPRLTGYFMEYISSFYFSYLIDKYKDKALSGNVISISKNPIKYYSLVRKFYKKLNLIFSINNQYINKEKYKIITILGYKFPKFKV